MCEVLNMAVFCRSLKSWFPGIIIIFINFSTNISQTLLITPACCVTTHFVLLDPNTGTIVPTQKEALRE